MGRRRALAGIAAGSIALGLCLVSPPAQASTLYVWSGAGDGNSWSDPDNWSPTGVPDLTSESARIPEGQVYIDRAYDVDSVELSGKGRILNDGGGSLLVTTFDMKGGTLSVPVKAASFAFTGPESKEVSSDGSIDATLVRGGNQGEVHISGGPVALSTDGTTSSGGRAMRAKTSITISARVDGRGANNAIVEVDDAACNNATSTFVCGIIVEAPSDSYGAAFEGVTLVSSNITFQNTATLALRGGYWKPRTGTKVGSVNDADGLLETGSAFPESDVPNEDVTMPSSLVLDGVTWTHVSGTVTGSGAISAGTNSGDFTWSGGTIQGRVDVKARVELNLEGTPDDQLELDAPSRGGASLSAEGGGRIAQGTVLVLDEASTFTNKSPVTSPFFQGPGSTITCVTSSSSVSKVVNQGHWVVDTPLVTATSVPRADEDAAVIESVPFVSTGSMALQPGGSLRLDGGRDNAISGKLSVNIESADAFGSIALSADSKLKLGGTLEAIASPSAGLASGDDLLVIESLADEGDPTGISGAFTSVTGTGLASGLGYSGELTAAGYVLSVGAPEPLSLSGKALARVKARKPLQITYVVTNDGSAPVEPQLNLPRLKGAKITDPTDAECAESGATLVCALKELPAGERAEVVLFYTFAKPGRQSIVTTVTSAGFNPTPERATSRLTVSVTR